MPAEYGYRRDLEGGMNAEADLEGEENGDVPTLEAAMAAMTVAITMMQKAMDQSRSQDQGTMGQELPPGGPPGVASMAVI